MMLPVLLLPVGKSRQIVFFGVGRFKRAGNGLFLPSAKAFDRLAGTAPGWSGTLPLLFWQCRDSTPSAKYEKAGGGCAVMRPELDPSFSVLRK